MPVEIVHPVPVDDVEPWLRQLGSALVDNTYDSAFPHRITRRRRAWDPERAWAVRDRGRIVGTFASYDRRLTVPGPGTTTHELPVDAVTGVSVAATHRRRGLLSAMIGDSLAAAKDRGDPLSALIAAEWPIYGRFGYAPATLQTRWNLDPRRTGVAAEVDRTRVRQVEPAEAGPIADAVFETARHRRAGQIDRPAPWWDRQVGLDGYDVVPGTEAYWFVHDGPDGVDGVVAWMAREHAELTGPGTVAVSQFIATSRAAERDLWGYLCGLDLVGDIELWGPVDDPARLLLDNGRALRAGEQIDFLWLRLLDVPAALAARAYAGDGDVVLDVHDRTVGGYAQGRVRLIASGGSVTCEPTDRAPDVRLDQRTLASMYLGGFRLRALATAQDVDELTPGTLDRLDVMFSTPLAPYTQTGF
ncbi:GNAT family N-acetyltransferase [Jatrophihabitans endophyticus]|uniref:GNAT family N-acetyltransferase n=1 Tax=Jatrophihabitans endophyticus TaxID=1206085 RepID=UPI001A0D41DB|nr:GNAT family N-acetyltransferase [Jatrophihabitans endophyticus]MBE7186676.1 GNAT family N-acetyltransferase [Jatrophihabitans endophyticus]